MSEIPAEKKLTTPNGTRRRRSPQEKKRLSLAKDRRNTHGENDKSSRKNLPLGRALKHRKRRRVADQNLQAISGEIEPTEVEDAEDAVVARQELKGEFHPKFPDEPLQDVLAWKAEPRVTPKQWRKEAAAQAKKDHAHRHSCYTALADEFRRRGFFGQLEVGHLVEDRSDAVIAQLQDWNPNWFTATENPDEKILELVSRAINVLNEAAVNVPQKDASMFRLRYEHFRLEFVRLLTPAYLFSRPENAKVLAKLHTPASLARLMGAE